MKKKQLLFVSSYIPEKIYNSTVNDFRDQQAQKFDRLMIKGFLNNGYSVQCISYLSEINGLDDYFEINEENCHFSIINNNSKTNYLSIIKKSYKKTRLLLQENQDSIVLCNILNISVSLGAVLAAKNCGNRVVGFITDMPIHMFGKFSVYKMIADFIIYQCTDLIFLTQQMSVKYRKNCKHYSIVEGLSDFSDQKNIEIKNDSYNPKNIKKRRILMYAGSLHKRYGIEMLVQAFCKISKENVELHIYGKGDFEMELQKFLAINKNIRYFGVVPNNKIVLAEKEVDLLINPRTSEGEYTKYSFPSKIIEYMTSGTPVLMNMLPGIPDEYREYCYCFESETIEGYTDTLEHILSMDIKSLQIKGKKAQSFVYENKNYTSQIKKVIHELELEE